MKKTIALLWIFAGVCLFMTACGSVSAAPEGTEKDSLEMPQFVGQSIDSIRSKYSDLLIDDYFECVAWKEQTTATVVISRDAKTATGYLRFDENGELLDQRGVSAVPLDDASALLNMTEEEFQSEYGEPHFDAGSGRYLPSYVTDHGSILTISIEDGIVCHVSELCVYSGETFYYGDELSVAVVVPTV